MSDKSIRSTLHHGRKAETDEVENEIVDWILINKSLGISVSFMGGNYYGVQSKQYFKIQKH